LERTGALVPRREYQLRLEIKCVTVVNQYGNLKATKTPVADCQEYVLISAVDYQEYKEPVLFNGDLFLYVS
ncbi:DUF1293 family protein, partial [Vibrio parahaemolyticus]|uniref:DUF1293 family protein n=1 Tax=Vibrio parahaemolyticus TaxID=670 RepID=UPI00111FE102